MLKLFFYNCHGLRTAERFFQHLFLRFSRQRAVLNTEKKPPKLQVYKKFLDTTEFSRKIFQLLLFSRYENKKNRVLTLY